MAFRNSDRQNGPYLYPCLPISLSLVPRRFSAMALYKHKGRDGYGNREIHSYFYLSLYLYRGRDRHGEIHLYFYLSISISISISIYISISIFLSISICISIYEDDNLQVQAATPYLNINDMGWKVTYSTALAYLIFRSSIQG